MVIVWCRACLSVGWRTEPASWEHFALRSLMRDWIREASEGVMWIVPGADLDDILMSWEWFPFFFDRELVLLGPDGYVVPFLVWDPLFFPSLSKCSSGTVLLMNMSFFAFSNFRIKSHQMKA